MRDPLEATGRRLGARSRDLDGDGGWAAMEFAGASVYAKLGLGSGRNGVRKLLRVCAKPERSTGRAVPRYNNSATAGLLRGSTGGGAPTPGRDYAC